MVYTTTDAELSGIYLSFAVFSATRYGTVHLIII